MKKLLIPLVGVIAVACSSSSDNGSGGDMNNPPTPPKGATASTTTGPYAEVDGLFHANCMPCHGAKSKAGGLSLASYDDLMKGGTDGQVVKAGDGDGSLVVQVLKGPVTAPAVPQSSVGR